MSYYLYLFETMKKLLIISQILYFSLFAQGNVYPVETSYGGGIGFGNMYMIMNEVPGSDVMDKMGFDADQLQTKPLVFYGGEGFAQMTGPWRLGGYAGIGASQISNVYDIVLYANRDGVPLYQEPAPGAGLLGDATYVYRGDGSTPLEETTERLSVKGKLNIYLGAVTAEYVFPIYRDLEVMAGALMGLGSYNLSVDQNIGTPTWSNLGRSMYGYMQGDSVMVELDANGGTFDDAADALDVKGVQPVRVTESMTEISSLFFNFQPYIAVKWQFLDRMGLRMSAGFNRGTIGAGRWRLNGHIPINNSPEASIGGFTVRTVIYFGL
tara:strand:- start:2414 stop:3385 length:972 start_codon:yes stop_codon:yes gene_type:complete